MDEEGILLENIDFNRLHWSSDFDGEDAGYPNINVVGYYIYNELNLYIDTETNSVLELWFDETEEEI